LESVFLFLFLKNNFFFYLRTMKQISPFLSLINFTTDLFKKSLCMAVNLPFSNLFIGTKNHLISGNYFSQIFLYYLSFFSCINLVSLLIFGKKSEQFHALFCIGSQILLVNVRVDSIFSFSLFWFLRHFIPSPHFSTKLHHTFSIFLSIEFKTQ
jgi:hypothetical protein